MENDFDAIKALFESQARVRQQKARGLGPQPITYEAEEPAARQPLVVPGMQFKRRSEQTAREKAAADVAQARPRVMAQAEEPEGQDPLARMPIKNMPLKLETTLISNPPVTHQIIVSELQPMTMQ